MVGMREQRVTADDPGDAPCLTEDAAMLLVDDELHGEGAVAHCAREDVRAAFAYLTHPLVGRATAVGTDGLVITVVPPGGS